jgi:thiol-disulfide isomerase/thioredoxin
MDPFLICICLFLLAVVVYFAYFQESDDEVDDCVIFVHARWCGHCRDMLPEVMAAKRRYPNCRIIVREGEKHPRLMKRYAIQAFPTLVVKKKKVVKKYVGRKNKVELDKIIKKAVKKVAPPKDKGKKK